MTRQPNNSTKSTQEYHSVLQQQDVPMLIIRLTPGMEALAQEMSTGERIYEQQWTDPTLPYSPQMSPLEFRPYEYEHFSPIVSPEIFDLYPSPNPTVVDGLPFLHSSPLLSTTQRQRAQRWMLDGTGAYPLLVIEESRVSFYATPEELKQALAERGPQDVAKIYLNLAHVVSIEKVIAKQVYTQNLLFGDVADGNNQQVPSVKPLPLTVDVPSTLPVPLRISDEMMFKINVSGGQAPYRFAMIGQPPDIYVTTDGWVRGFVDESVWPTTGYREFLIRILVQDSAIPRASAIFDYRFRLAPALP